MKQPGPYQCAADVPQKHMTGEFFAQCWFEPRARPTERLLRAAAAGGCTRLTALPSSCILLSWFVRKSKIRLCNRLKENVNLALLWLDKVQVNLWSHAVGCSLLSIHISDWNKCVFLQRTTDGNWESAKAIILWLWCTNCCSPQRMIQLGHPHANINQTLSPIFWENV